MLLKSKLWTLNVPTKAKHLLWRFCNGLLPKYENMRRKVMIEDEACFSFDGRDVNVIHTLFKCEYARAVWFACPLNFRLDDIEADSINMSVLLLCCEWDVESLCLWSMVAWGIWLNRHIRCQGKEGFDPINLVNKVVSELYEFQNRNLHVKLLGKRIAEQMSWVAPVGECVKINCHISHSYSNDIFLGCVIRDEMGDVLGSLARIMKLDQSLSIIDVHERTVFESLKFGLDIGFRSITIESDYLPIVNKLQSINYATPILANMIFRTTSLHPNDYDISISYINPDDIQLAESVADYAQYVGDDVWIEDLPPGVLNTDL